MKTIYVVSENSDSTEGRGHQVTVAHFKYEEDARNCAKGRGPMGMSDGNVEGVSVYDSFYEFEHVSNRESLRERALAKLTQEEKEALGLL